MDDETVGSTQDENTDHNSNQLSSITENKKKIRRNLSDLRSAEDL